MSTPHARHARQKVFIVVGTIREINTTVDTNHTGVPYCFFFEKEKLSKHSSKQQNVRLVYESSMEAEARRLGATELRPSWRKGTKWAVLYEGRYIHYGARGYDDYNTHHDEERRASYRKRHAGILLGDGRPAYKVKTSPAYWSWHLLW